MLAAVRGPGLPANLWRARLVRPTGHRGHWGHARVEEDELLAHRHREQEEAYVVVGGSGRANLDGEIVALGVWDVLRVAPTVVRSFEVGPEGLDLICIGGHRPAGGDGETAPDPWEGLLRIQPGRGEQSG